ncbi:hypothetical protein T439DRAFT_307251 [Meredithblackwellia eburnea MCA 4105]
MTKSEATAVKTHKWALSPYTRMNGPLLSLLPTVLVIALTIYINKSTFAPRFYHWLNSNYTPFQINSWWTFGITTVVYWIGGLVFMALDMWEPLRKRVEKYKLQPTQRVTWKDYRKVCLIVLRNQLVTALPLCLAIAYLRPLPTTFPLPSATRTISTFIFCLLVEEAGFFYVHRFFHSPKYYKTYHKKHHEFTAPVALASTYCTVVEHYCSNTLPIVAGILIVRAHWCMNILFFCALELGTLATHSGYNFPGSFNALQHDWHHYSFTENFGPMGLLDRIHNTDKMFRSWLEELHRRETSAGAVGGGDDIVKKARVELNSLENEKLRKEANGQL